MSILTGGYTAALSPDTTRTAIDKVLFEKYDREEQPDVLSARNPMFFKQDRTDSMAFIYDEYSNVGRFDVHQEQEEVKITNIRTGNQTSRSIVKYMKSVPVSWEAFKTDRHGLRAHIGADIGDRARLSEDRVAILETYGDAFVTTGNTTPDGAALASNSHTTITGGTVDNLETGSLTPTNLWTAVVSLTNQQGQDDELGSHVFTGLLVPTTLYRVAREVMNSTLIANSAENNLNIFYTTYGTVAIKHSPFLGSTYNSASNANTSYHLISQNHFITHMILDELSTDLIEPRYSRTDSWEYRARFAQDNFPGSWTGVVSSNGSV